MLFWFIGFIGFIGLACAPPDGRDRPLRPVLEEVGPARGLRRLVVETNEPARIDVSVDDGLVTWVLPPSAAATSHEVLVAGLRPDASHTITVVATFADGATRTETYEVETEPLPDDFPPFTVVVADTVNGGLEPGLTLLRIGRYLALVDDRGEVRWWLAVDHPTHELDVTGHGTLRMVAGKDRILERDVTGAVVAAWSAEPLGLPALHHDVADLPGGRLLALTVERRWVEGYPSSAHDPAAEPEDVWVVGDVVVEIEPLDRQEARVVRRWPLLDLLDPRRVAYDGVRSGRWGGVFDDPEVRDWSHANSVWFDAGRGEIVVSLRHQDAVVAIGRDDGALRWLLAPDAHWAEPWQDRLLRPAEPRELVPYHQHAARITPAGTLLLFDNGNGRASAFEPRLPDARNGSRCVELALDHHDGTWRRVWDVGSGLDPLVFAGSLGDCDVLPETGHVLATFGQITSPAGPGMPGAVVAEVTREDSVEAEILWQLRLPEPLATARAARVAGWLPGF